jgi:hypothetical protein
MPAASSTEIGLAKPVAFAALLVVQEATPREATVMAECQFELYWIALAGFVGLSLGSCGGIIIAGLLPARRFTPPRIPTGRVSRETVDMTRLDIDRWYDHATRVLSEMRRGLE